VVKLRQQGGKSVGSEKRAQFLPPSGKEGATNERMSVTVAKRPHVQEQALRSAGNQGRQTGCCASGRVQCGGLQGSLQAGRVGKASGQGAVPLLATRLVDIALLGDVPVMVSTRTKALARRSMGTQMEVLHNYMAVWISGCRKCLSLTLVLEDSRDKSSVWCNQVNGLLSLVAELKEEVEG